MVLTCVADCTAPLRQVLQRQLSLSGTLLKAGRDAGAFRINGIPACLNALVSPGDTVAAVLTEAPPPFPAEDGPLDILYEDEALLAVDKPAGLWCHPTASRLTGTLANRAAGYFARTGQPCGVHLVTRLDRDTFGVVLLVKHGHIHTLLGRLQTEGQLCKTYLAAVAGAPPAAAGTVDAPIARQAGGSLRREIRQDGQQARTEYRILEQCGGQTLLALRPVTGRTHQLRVHCAAIGCPILGDRDYGRGESCGLQLCAAELAMPHPLTGLPVAISSRRRPLFPVPANFLHESG